MDFKKIRKIIDIHIKENNHVLVSVDFKKKIAYNLYVFTPCENYEISELCFDCIKEDPVLMSEKSENINIEDIPSKDLKNVYPIKKPA